MPSPPAAAAGDWRERARAIGTALAATAAEADRTDRLPASAVGDLRAARFFGLGLPVEWGGSGGDSRATVAVLEELAAGSAAVATLLAVHLSVAAQPVLQWGTDAQRERFLRPLSEGRAIGAFGLTEPETGSDAAHLASRYRVDGNGFVLDGEKTFITNAGLADLLLVFATRDRSEGAHGVSAFVLPKGTPGFTVTTHFDKLGLRGSETNAFSLAEVRLPSDALLGPEGAGMKVALGALTGGRVGIAACALGVARAALETMQSAAREDPADWKRSEVARSFTEVAAARALVAEAARLKDEGRAFVEAASAAKLFASQVAVRVATRGVDVAGRPGVTSGAAAERLLRDARVFPIVEGTTEIQELVLGRALVGR